MRSLPPAAATAEMPRIEIAVFPDGSEHAPAVRNAAKLAGASFVRADLASGSDIASRLTVVDLTRVLAAGRLGPRVIAISHDRTLDAYDVVHPDEVDTRLPRAVRNLVETEVLRARVEQERASIEVLNQIGYALSAHTDLDELLGQLLTQARRLLSADGGSVYLVRDGQLAFAAAQNDTVRFQASRQKLPVDETSLAGYVACHAVPLQIADVRRLPPDVPYRPNLTFDEQTGYRTKSMVVVPMVDRDEQVIGVLTLINRKPTAGVPLASFERILPFTDRHVAIARSIAGQAAVALENHRLYADIERLFHGFVAAAVTAIEARDPSTGGHSHRVAALTTLLAREITTSEEEHFRDVRFSGQELTELHYAAMLHDFGKVGVREEVLLKGAKLFPWELEHVEMRFRLAALQALLESVRHELAEHHLAKRLATLDADLKLVRQLNRPTAQVTHVDVERVQAIAERWRLQDLGGEPVLRQREIARLCIPRGSLDPDERAEIERHVEHTYRFLQVIPWTRDLSRVPELAYAHHEKLDGTGYPRRLGDRQIPYGAKLMAIADIFDALTAGDRPYKDGMTPDQALRILRDEAERGKILAPAVELFAERRLWEQMKVAS
ncbi:MAG: HD domain-containing phosphohydrolase [Myxococcota bacterium]